MKKNCKIHLWLETELKESIEKQAEEEGISICEFCRRRLRDNSKIIKMEMMVERILSILENRKIYKEVPRMNSSIG